MKIQNIKTISACYVGSKDENYSTAVYALLENGDLYFVTKYPLSGWIWEKVDRNKINTNGTIVKQKT